ncbi:MAG TPA: hypothetical protein VFZ34_13165 [Blastocatellia bacterium]|nr:hypothetical protein [Blastocatellia bacterium]
MMSSQAQQRVRRLLLHAPQAELIQRGRILLEDAFHTVSVPDENGSRLLLIRSLKLGRIPSHLSSTSLALLIEKRLAQLQTSAVYALWPQAQSAASVYFQNDVEPFVHLAVRLARQSPVTEWFWPLAVPEWNHAMPPATALRHVLFGAGKTSVGATGTALLAITMLEHEAIEPLLEALQEADGIPLVRLLGAEPFPPPPASFAASSAAVVSAAALPTVSQVVRHWVRKWGAEDARSHWLAALCWLRLQPHRTAVPALAQKAFQLVQALTTHSISWPNNPTASVPATPDVALPQRAEGVRETDSATRLEVPSSTVASSVATKAHPSSDTTPAVTQAAAEQLHNAAPPLEAREAVAASTRAGLFFLLPVLSRLGMQDWLEQHPALLAMDFPSYLLRSVCARLATPEDDVIWQTLALATTPSDPVCRTFVAPVTWARALSSTGPHKRCRVIQQPENQVLCDSSRRLIFAQWQQTIPNAAQELLSTSDWVQGNALAASSDLELLCQSWFTALRRWCRRAARIGLSELVCRPGRVTVTRTHLDVWFTLQQADLCIRRAGLDLDPGWVPWFGKVVSFYYRNTEQ